MERFPDPPKKYDGPDYYCKVKVKGEKSSFPAHYFVSDVEKGLPQANKENQEPKDTTKENYKKSKKANLSYQMCMKKQKIKK